MFKFSGIALVVMIGSFVGFVMTTDEAEVAEESEETKDIANVEPKKVETSAKATEDAEKENKNEDAELYKQDILMHLDAFQDEYDKHWENNWVTTFEGVSDGSVDAYTAYSTLNSLEKYYTGLGNKTRNTELPELSKENQKLLDAYLKDFRSAILTRSRAASEAAEMFDKGEFKPSEMDKIKSTVNYADQELLSAMSNRVKLEQELGITE